MEEGGAGLGEGQEQTSIGWTHCTLHCCTLTPPSRGGSECKMTVRKLVHVHLVSFHHYKSLLHYVVKPPNTQCESASAPFSARQFDPPQVVHFVDEANSFSHSNVLSEFPESAIPPSGVQAGTCEPLRHFEDDQLRISSSPRQRLAFSSLQNSLSFSVCTGSHDT